MAETALKVVTDKVVQEAPAAAAPKARSLRETFRAHRRLILLVILPLIALVVGTGFYLSGGRYISTDNAYVGAQKVLITPDISGKIDQVSVREGQHVAAGDALFTIDRQPFAWALAQAEAKLASAKTEYENLKTNFASLTTMVDLAQKNAELKQHDVDRKAALAKSSAGSQADLDTANANLVTAQLQSQYAAQQRATTLNQLLGDPDVPLERFPAYAQALAARDQAKRDLDHTVVRAPIAGTATQVDSIQLGRFVTAGMPVFSVVDDSAPWVDANPKETDITWLRVGQKATVEVDTFPDHVFHGRVAAVSPGTGAQFSILPPQNASGNWVKVVQRVPVRVVLDPDDQTANLRAGMSATVDIDTGRSRSLGSLVGLTSPGAAVAGETKTHEAK